MNRTCVWCGRTGSDVEAFQAQGAEVGLCTLPRVEVFFAGTEMEMTEYTCCRTEVQGMGQFTEGSERWRKMREERASR